jgi:hypothetical protein
MHPTQKPADTGPTDTGELTGTPADTLRVAATYLETHGWTQGVFFAGITDLYPPACAAGAIRAVVYGYPDDKITPAHPLLGCVQAALSTLAESLGLADSVDADWDWFEVVQDTIASWNDATERTLEQVVQALRDAADDYDRETYGGNELDHDRLPTEEGFRAWQYAQATTNDDSIQHTGGAV